MVTIVENGHGNPSSNLEQGCIPPHSAYTLGKDMNPIIYPPVMGK